ncbi:sigma-70 family RNA polymerase sigma factor [Actinomadura sp. 3N407]|uniref:sigma-70 family RNA polymerase sigma factor n=1 Tax=Actinomadura sp. 3N407 TaxID=3457423 RepID=UPI003FCD5B4F
MTTLLASFQDATTELARIRRETLGELKGHGLTQKEIAAVAGLSRGRIGQLAQAGPRPERVFLGDSCLTVAVARKRQEGRLEPVIAEATVHASKRLTDLAATYQLEVEVEPISPPGIIDLNRDNLIVMAGPRMFPMVGQILSGDPSVAFIQDDSGGWSIKDLHTGQEFRPHTIEGKHHDFAYFGRLPRPDGKGTFLCIAGVHATGTQGVVAYLEKAVAEVYAEVKTRRFSMIVACEYDPDTLKVTSAESASPIYRRGS